ncbi:myosin class V heavy chain [Metschnikowia bicuspidata var. bicuspidata NRRL YB-4993]|uniref:Myosin class V heavy chain n=1 Tax=Metschnikowia bicuspidata var. bicuspidata NRRL YB-4993 TaxID=869754 RepID=A0A1A0H7E8_9ASCO|nr:myosin class V heavy chain [Metschnikowia bicuspidata var. bicuspidata NRRL YB-4993]OBA19951.1 myosin class V heavy chain [Metschnikowia bicuspidata var. bicuspidata NRRL YB-4993]
MDAWTDSSPSPFVLSAGSQCLDAGNPLFAGIVHAKQQLQTELASQAPQNGPTNTSKTGFFSAVCEGDLVTAEAAIAADPGLVASFYPEDKDGFPPLVFAVVFQQTAIVDSLLRIHDVDPDMPDKSPAQYTPLMWAISVKDVSIMSLLLEFQADPELSPTGNGVCASSLASKSTPEIFDYFKTHNLFTSGPTTAEVYPLHSFGDSNTDSVDDVALKIRMLTLANSQGMELLDSEDSADEEATLALDSHLLQLSDFNYHKPLPEQFIKFSDLDIPSLLDYIFGLRTSSPAQQHNTKAPAAILFQLVHYSHNKVDSRDLTEFLFECFVTRLRSVTNTKSGVFNMALTVADQNDKKPSSGAGDIVLLSYWLSVIQFLHFYLTKAELYSQYPKFLHELMNLTQSLVATLSFSINSRLNVLADDCMLNFTSLVDVSSVLYAKDWNIFKTQKKHPNSYDDILKMLFPPTLNDLMKPSPLRYVQVLGALYYVLEIHGVDPLLRLQTFSQVFYYINAIIFNRLMANSQYCSRIKAIQIRLNLSALEDWLRSHDFRAHKPDRIGGLGDLLNAPDGAEIINNATLLEGKNEESDPHYLSFYYKSLYHIAKTQLLPTIELLQWLQIMTGLEDEESLINTINEFDTLNYYQLVKLTAKLYRYEVSENKFPKSLIQLLKRLVAEQGEAQISKTKIHYMTQSTFLLKEVYIYLNPNHIFGVALPNASELINNYGAGIGGVKRLRAKKYQPSLPIKIMDDIDMILTHNKNEMVNGSYDYDESETEQIPLESESLHKHSPERQVFVGEKKVFKGDELFKQMQPPLSLAHKEWGADEMESNPW